MSEKKPLPLSSFFTKVIVQKQQAEDKLKSSYARLIRLLHAREFMAELLATFILVVRLLNPSIPEGLAHYQFKYFRGGGRCFGAQGQNNETYTVMLLGIESLLSVWHRVNTPMHSEHGGKCPLCM